MKIFIFYALFLIHFTVAAQSLPDSTKATIDRLFDKWNNIKTPGCVVGIIQDNQLVYAKGLGLANLEFEIPNSSTTIFYMCSLSKQFTGYAIARLANEGKLNLDDDIHKYLPWMRDFNGKKITIQNLLNHTSGIRDDIGLSQFFGLSTEGMLTQELAVSLLKKQHTLNFNPGEKFSYSNANYVLLAEIIKKVSGKSFREFIDSAIFKPLNMTSSTFVDDYSEVIKNRASSYVSNNGIYHNAVQNVYTLGDGGMFTNIEDMSKWVMNFYNPKSGTINDINLMTTPGKLRDNTAITYAMGIDVTMHRGYKRLIHNGGLAGYHTIIAVYPELKIGFLVFGNGGDREVYNKIDQLAEIFIPNKEKVVAPKNYPMIILKDSADLKKWTGNYISRNGYKVEISYKAGTLYANKNVALVPEDINLFHMATRPVVKYKFDLEKKFTRASLISPVRNIEMTRVKDIQLSNEKMSEFVGTYFSEELAYFFKIEIKEHELWISGKNIQPAKISLSGAEHMFTESDMVSHLLIKRDAKNKIIGLELNSGDTADLIFRKI